MESRRLQNGMPIGAQAIDEILSMPFTQEIFRNGIRSDPFVNELARIRHSMTCLKQKHKQKILNIRPQYGKEMERIERKYDLLLKIEDATFKKKKTLLADLRQKVERGLSVDEELTAHFGEQVELNTSHQGMILVPSTSVEVKYQNNSTHPLWLKLLLQIRFKSSDSALLCALFLLEQLLSDSTAAPFFTVYLAETLRVPLENTLVLEAMS